MPLSLRCWSCETNAPGRKTLVVMFDATYLGKLDLIVGVYGFKPILDVGLLESPWRSPLLVHAVVHSSLTKSSTPPQDGVFSDSVYGLISYVMALVYNVDTSSRKSRRDGTSGRRRITNTTDKYAAALGSSSYSLGKDSVMHVLRVQPGVVVNFIETPSSSSRNHSWTMPRVVEYKSSRKSSHSHTGDDRRDPSWSMTHSPHPHSMDLIDGRHPVNSFGDFKEHAPPRDPHRSPVTHHFIPEEHFPEPRYAEPSRYTEPRYPEPQYPESHFSEAHHPVEFHESLRQASSPVDIPTRRNSHDFSDFSLHSPSISDSDSVPFNHGPHSGDPYHFGPHHSPPHVEMPIHITPSPRSRRRSLDFTPSSKPPSPTSSSNTRTVRFRDDPVSSPPARRKGWWNRKGDQLWNNDGAYAPAAEPYPLDLQNYPEPGIGWMNEEGVQIDMKRRLMRKKPLRSALKKTSL